jgi:hypothetical protein
LRCAANLFLKWLCRPYIFFSLYYFTAVCSSLAISLVSSVEDGVSPHVAFTSHVSPSQIGLLLLCTSLFIVGIFLLQWDFLGGVSPSHGGVSCNCAGHFRFSVENSYCGVVLPRGEFVTVGFDFPFCAEFTPFTLVWHCVKTMACADLLLFFCSDPA